MDARQQFDSRGRDRSRSARRALGIAAIWLVATAAGALAHKDPVTQITELSQQIALHPNDASLYLRRADLHRSRGAWTPAYSDLQTARRLDPALVTVDLLGARVLFEADKPRAALTAIDAFLARDDGRPGAHLLRARILAKLGRHAEATVAFTRGIDMASAAGTPAQPDDYLDRARTLTVCGDAHVDDAIRGLDQGATLLGGAITLQLLAIELETARAHWDAAIARVTALETRAVRKELWLERRADILLRAARTQEAARCYREALAAMEALPQRLRTTRSTSESAARIRARLADLDAASAAQREHAGPRACDLAARQNHSSRTTASGRSLQ